MLRKLLSHAAIYGLSAQLPRLAGVLALPLITQYLTPTDYGVAGVMTAYFMAFIWVQALGFSVAMNNSYIRYPSRYQWVWRQLYGFLTIWSIPFSMLVLVVFYLVVPEEAEKDRLAITLLNGLPFLLFTITDSVSSQFCLIAQRPLLAAIRSFAVGFTYVGLTVYLIAFERMGYMGWFYASFTSAAVGFLVSFYIVLSQRLLPIFKFKWHRIKHALRISLPALPDHFSYFMLETSDRLVLDRLGVPVRNIGLYNVASNFGTYFMSASWSVVMAATPFYMKLYAQARNRAAALQIRAITYALQLMFFAATFLASLWMKEIFVLLIRNEDLRQAYPLAIIILMGYNFRPMYMAVANLLTYHELTGNLWRISTVAGIGNIVLNLILVPLYGFEMAAYTTFAALLYMGYSGYLLKAYRERSVVNLYPIWWLLATVALLVLAYQLREAELLVKAMITVVVAVAGIAAAFRYKKLAQV